MEPNQQKAEAPSEGTANPKPHFHPEERLNRVQLCRMRLAHLRRLRESLGQRVEAANAELMALLEERDALSMQMDALAVEAQDLGHLAKQRGGVPNGGGRREGEHLQVQ